MFFDLDSSYADNCFSVLNACWTKWLFSHLKKLHIPYKTTNLHTALTRPALFYGNKPLAARKIGKRRSKSAGICFVRFAGYALLDSRIQDGIVREIRSPQIVGLIKQHGRNWLIMHGHDEL
jgi:hypothetical protein